jgi:PAS domain S-box-containing protein
VVDDPNVTENLDSRYKELFQLVPVSIWEENFSELQGFLDDLQANGVSNFNEYLSEHPDFIFDAFRMIHVVDVNDYTIMMYEARDKAELLESTENIFTQESIMAYKDAIIALVEGKPYFEGESTTQTLGGKTLNVLIKIHYPDKPEQLNRVVISITDITHLNEMKRELQESENRYRSLFDNISSGVAIYEAIEDGNDFVIKEFNKAAENIERVNATQIIGKKVTDVFPGTEKMGLMDVFRSVWNTGIQQFLPATFYTDERISGWRENFVYRISKDEIVAVYNDISEKINNEEMIRQYEENLRNSEEKYRMMLENASDMVTVLDENMKTEYVNENQAKLLGYEREEMIGSPALVRIHPEDIPFVIKTFKESFERGEGSGEARMLHKDGSYTWFDIKGKTFVGKEGKKWALLQSRDISESKKMKEELMQLNQELEQRVEERTIANEKLLKSEKRYKIMLENASDMVEVLDDNMIHEYVNENELKLLGYELEDLIGKSVLEFVHPDDIKSNIEQFMAGFARGEGAGEFRIRCKDGRYTWFDIKGKTFNDPDGTKKALLLSRDISESKRMKDELVELNKDLEQRVEERTRDLEETQEKLIRQEKLAAVGKISSTISHELRNPLATINNSVYFLNMKLGDADEKIRKHIEIIQAEVDRSRQIISNLLDFTRIKQLKFAKANILVVIKNALSHVAVPDGITIQTLDNAGDLQLDVDSDLIQQVFINIITNAIQAMPQGGNLSITIESDGDLVTVKFKDSGVGIPPENIPKLFEPLFTTKKSGIGLGLTLVKDIIDRHGGEINVESDEGLGTTFTIILPFRPRRPRSSGRG